MLATGLLDRRKGNLPMMYLRHSIDTNTDEGRYLIACARIRKCSASALVKRLLEVVMKDQLVLSVLDDESKPAERRPGEHGFSA